MALINLVWKVFSISQYIYIKYGTQYVKKHVKIYAFRIKYLILITNISIIIYSQKPGEDFTTLTNISYQFSLNIWLPHLEFDKFHISFHNIRQTFCKLCSGNHAEIHFYFFEHPWINLNGYRLVWNVIYIYINIST